MALCSTLAQRTQWSVFAAVELQGPTPAQTQATRPPFAECGPANVLSWPPSPATVVWILLTGGDDAHCPQKLATAQALGHPMAATLGWTRTPNRRQTRRRHETTHLRSPSGPRRWPVKQHAAAVVQTTGQVRLKAHQARFCCRQGVIKKKLLLLRFQSRYRCRSRCRPRGTRRQETSPRKAVRRVLLQRHQQQRQVDWK